MIKKAKQTKSKTSISKKVTPKATKKTVKKVTKSAGKGSAAKTSAKLSVKKTPSPNRLNNLIQLPKRSVSSKTSRQQHFIMRINGKLVFE